MSFGRGRRRQKRPSSKKEYDFLQASKVNGTKKCRFISKNKEAEVE